MTVLDEASLRDSPLRARAGADLCGEMRVGAAIAGSVADTGGLRQVRGAAPGEVP